MKWIVGYYSSHKKFHVVGEFEQLELLEDFLATHKKSGLRKTLYVFQLISIEE